MSNIDCTKTTIASEIALCACKRSVDQYKILSDAYMFQKKKFTDDNASYLRWSNKHNDWLNTTGDYARFKNKDFKQEIDSGQCWGQPRGNGDWHCAEAARNKNLPYSGDWKDIGKDTCCDGCGWGNRRK